MVQTSQARVAVVLTRGDEPEPEPSGRGADVPSWRMNQSVSETTELSAVMERSWMGKTSTERWPRFMLPPELQTRKKTEAAEGDAPSLVRSEQGQFRTQFLEGGGGSDGSTG